MEDLSKLIESARQAFAEATQPAALEDAKAKFLGKSGTLTTMMKGLRDLAADQRKAAGAEINAGTYVARRRHPPRDPHLDAD